MLDFLKTEKIFTVFELNNAIRGLIKGAFPDYIWVCGEIQDLKNQASKKHLFFNLIQKHPEADEIIAQARAVVFEDTKAYLFKRLKDAGGDLSLKDDIEVKLLCRVDFYAKRGQYSLVVSDIDPTYTLGRFAQNRQKIIEELTKRGLLKKNKLIPLVPCPLQIGLITSGDSAAYHDFVSELKMSGFSFKVHLIDARMQGKRVEPDVVGALKVFNRTLPQTLDVVVITRGGGSSADLSWFDNKKIAESIAGSSFPVISALGHEINTTVCDLVAHTYCKTPTKAAQFLTHRVKDFLEEAESLTLEIVKEAADILRRGKSDLELKTGKFDACLATYFSDQKEHLAEKKSCVFTALHAILHSHKVNLKSTFSLLKIASANYTKGLSRELILLQEKIGLLDPRNILKRGYSITLKEGKSVKDTSSLTRGDSIESVFFKGRTRSRIEEIEQ